MDDPKPEITEPPLDAELVRFEHLRASGQATPADFADVVHRLKLELVHKSEQARALRLAQEALRQHEDIANGLATPIVQIWDGVLTVPVMGSLSSERAEILMDRLLAEIVTTRSRYALLDLTSVELIDTSTADHLVKIVRAIELLGARAVITGIRSAVAQTIVSIGVDLSQILTLRNLQQGLAACIRWMATEHGSGAETV
jgi:rsbT co-antagonist protein RsbR